MTVYIVKFHSQLALRIPATQRLSPLFHRRSSVCVSCALEVGNHALQLQERGTPPHLAIYSIPSQRVRKCGYLYANWPCKGTYVALCSNSNKIFALLGTYLERAYLRLPRSCT
jgi:hypothetical protein